MSQIIYEPHPVSPERKRELVGQGYKIIDARFAPESEQRQSDETEPAKRTRGKRK